MKILWAGPYFSEYAFTVKRTPNIASTVWSHGFVKGLLANGVDVEVVTLCPEQAWPKGRVVWQNSDERLFDHDVPVTAVPYLNVAGIREWWQRISFGFVVKSLLAKGNYDALACYDVIHPYHRVAMGIAKSMGVKTFPIILGSGYDIRLKGFSKMSRQCKYADGVTFLSKWCAERFPANGRRIMQMEGGVSEWSGKPPKPKSVGEKFTVTYAGGIALHKGRGLIDFIKSTRRRDVRFVICGKWDSMAIGAEIGCDSRVELRGVVSSDELKKIYSETDVFVNCRDGSCGNNLADFPSKLLAYLGYGRPIVSNWVDSFPNEYRDILCVTEDDTSGAMAKMLDEVLSWDDLSRMAHYEKIKRMYETGKSWVIQAKRFIDFIEGGL